MPIIDLTTCINHSVHRFPFITSKYFMKTIFQQIFNSLVSFAFRCRAAAYTTTDDVVYFLLHSDAFDPGCSNLGASYRSWHEPFSGRLQFDETSRDFSAGCIGGGHRLLQTGHPSIDRHSTCYDGFRAKIRQKRPFRWP